MLTQAELKELLTYDLDTGVFTNRITRSPRALVGKFAGYLRDDYCVIVINRKDYLAHRLAWLYVHGSMPDQFIDHVNGNRSDNRIENLRLATRKQNAENQQLNASNTSGHRGVSWHKHKQKWEVRVCHFNKSHFVGLFDTIEAAANAAKQTRDQLFTHHKTEYAA